MNKKKILLITSEFPPQPGGIGNHSCNLALALTKEGKQLIVLSDVRSKDGNSEKLFDAQLPFQVRRIKRRKVIILSYFDRFIKATKLIKSVDTVLVSGKFSLWLGYFLNLFYQKKYIAIIHGSEVLLPNNIQRKFTNSCLKKFKSVIAVSNYTKSLVASLSLNNIIVIPNGFNQLEIDKKSPPHQKPINLHLITVGNVTQRKGQHNMLKAIPMLLQEYPNLQYHIVGIPTEKKRIENLAKELDITNHIVFYGKVSEEKKIALLKSSSIFMMLSETTPEGDVEGFGIAVLEANAYGIPAIGSKDCGIEDAINHGKSGVLVNAKDPKMIVKAINTIMNSYDTYSGNASKWSSKFKWEKVIKQYLKVLDK